MKYYVTIFYSTQLANNPKTKTYHVNEALKELKK